MLINQEDCIFCKIASKEIPSNIIYEDDKICCFLDIDPINEGHILIIPKTHYLDVDELDEDTSIAIMKFSIVMINVLKKAFNPDGYSIMQNGGIFNDVGHYHMHIFPRYEDDEFSWSFKDNVDLENSNIIRDKLICILHQYVK